MSHDVICPKSFKTHITLPKVNSGKVKFKLSLCKFLLNPLLCSKFSFMLTNNMSFKNAHDLICVAALVK